ncbi:MAG: M35 family metallo-endopeptidase [Cellvibrio sp.]
MAVKHCTGKRSTHTPGRHPGVARALHPQRQPYQQVVAVQETIHSSGSGTVSARSSLPANEHSAPSDPTSVVTAADASASGQLSAAVLFPMLSAISIEHGVDPSTTTSYNAYLARFDRPEEINGRFRNRFSRAMFSTENEAMTSELNSLSDRFSSLETYLAGGIRYISNSDTRVRVGTCRDRCSAHPQWGAWTCSERNARAIALCPLFWRAGASQQAGIIVHELAHMRFGIANHDAGTQRQRARNPECYASYVADLFGYRPFSAQCPSV